MLMMNRHVGEAIIIETSDGPVTVAVVEITRSNVRLALDAPPTVRVTRTEESANYPTDNPAEDAQ